MLLACLLVTGLTAVSQVAFAASLNEVRAVEVNERGSVTEVRILGSQRPTYTVFKLAEPTRIVVDLSTTDISKVERLVDVDTPAVKAIMTTQFDDAEAKVGRVMVVLVDGADYDVKASGNDVLVTVRSDEGSATAPTATETAAASAESSEVTVPEQDALASQTEETVSEEPAVSAASADEPAEVAKVELVDESPAEPSSELPENALAQDEDVLPAGRRTGSKLLAIRTGVDGALTTVAMDTDGQPSKVEWIELVNPSRLALDLVGITQAPKRAQTQALRRSDTVKNVRIGKHADRVRVVVDGRADTMGDYDVVRTRKGVALRVRKAPDAAAILAESEPADDATEADTPKRGMVQALTYARSEQTGRVVVGMQEAGRVRYRVSQPDPRTAVLTLAGTGLEKSLEQTFDASSYGGAVKAVTAFTDPTEPDRVKVVATLAEPVRSRIVPMRGGLSWEFDFGAAGVVQNGDKDTEGTLGPAAIETAGLTSEGAMSVASSGERARKGYHGRRVNLEFKEIDIHNVLRLIAEVSKRNIVVSDDVSGKITLRLRNVPWDQALDLILKSKGLGRETFGNIIRIAPAEQLAKERELQVKERESRKKLEPLKVRLVGVNFAKADEMAKRVQEILTERGVVTVDKRTNFLIIKDVSAALTKAEQLVQKLDSETPQVQIESRIVEANVNFTREIGVQWGGNITMSPTHGNPTGLVFPNIVSVAGSAADGQTPVSGTSDTPNFMVNMPAPIGTNSGGGLGFIFGSAGGAANLNLRLSAMENDGVVKTISAPKVVTLDNQKATISQGLSIPFSQVSAAGVNTTFIQAKLQLDVTPHVTTNGSILMDVNVTNNQPNPQLTGANGQPSISQKEAKTTVMVKDGDTTVIGGVYTRQNSEANNRVPGFSRIPILGWLFRKKNVQDQRTELLVFITPRIVNRSASTVGAL
ncbi:MAG: type IV pilus secretin PilQ [Deltaproteobacteria bacterium]|nr:type IV pilus secretin PilQ [Deltaproteobacteria bacterium]